MAKRAIQLLPTEIRQLIVDHLAGIEYSFSAKGYYEGTLEHIVDIKSLRLSCRAFADLTSQYLFRSVWLFMTDESFSKLKSIASTPSFAKYVRRLKIFWTLLDATTFPSEQKYRTHLEMTPLYDVPELAVKQGWSALQSIFSQQDRLNPQIGEILAETLSSFLRLSEIEPGVAWEVLRHTRAMELQNGTVQQLVRKTLLHGSCDAWRRDLHGGPELHKLFHAMERSRCCGQKLVLFNCGGNISSGFLDFPDEMLQIAETVAGGLTEVRLRLETDDDRDLDPIVESGYGSRFLGWLQKTERLCLQTSINSFLINLELLMPLEVTLPCLRHLALYRLTTSGECLLGVLERHKETLNTMSIVETTLVKGSWRGIFTKFRDQEEIQQYHFEDNYLRRRTGSPRNPINVTGTELEVEMDRFVFRGEDWPEEGAEDLEVEAFS